VTAPLRAVLFDVGDTLVDTTAMPDISAPLTEALCREFGERPWYPQWIAGKIAPPRSAEGDLAAIASGDEQIFRQETIRWYTDWFRSAGISSGDIDVDRLRSTMCIPLDRVTTPVRGAFDAVRWCKSRGLAVVLVSNTLSRGDEESWVDARRLGIADAIDGLVTSHTVGWQKPHRRIFERALEVAKATPEHTVMVGDRLLADIWGAKRSGMRAVLRRTPATDQAPVDVAPDATIDDLTELPAVLTPWLGGPLEKS
jgi:FMN phosphatase YigB (HAD superfamily)